MDPDNGLAGKVLKCRRRDTDEDVMDDSYWREPGKADDTRSRLDRYRDDELERAREQAMAEGRPAFVHDDTIFATDATKLWVGLGTFKAKPGESAKVEGIPRLLRVYAQVSELTGGERIGTRLVAEMACGDINEDGTGLAAVVSDGVWNLDSNLTTAELANFWPAEFEDLKGALFGLGIAADDIIRWERDTEAGLIEIEEDDRHRHRHP